jgi:hypothetical protein
MIDRTFNAMAIARAWLYRQPAGTFTVAVLAWSLAMVALGRSSVAPEVRHTSLVQTIRDPYPVVVTRYQCGNNIIPLGGETKK